MDMTAALIIGLLLGLVNGAHCAGMCGAFAIRAAVGPSRGGSVLRFVLYALGKVFTYVFLGALVGAVGQRLFLSARPFQAVMGVVVAALLVVAGLRLLGFLLRPGASGAFLAGKLAPYIRAATEKGPFVMGAVTGALPCGVGYDDPLDCRDGGPWDRHSSQSRLVSLRLADRGAPHGSPSRATRQRLPAHSRGNLHRLASYSPASP